MSAWRFMLMNDLPRARTDAETALELAAKTGFEIAEAQAYFALAHLLRLSGEGERGRELLVRCRRVGRRMGSTIVEYMSLLSEATFAFAENREKAGRASLKSALALGRANGYVYFCWWHASLLTPLCLKALEVGIETEYVKGLIHTCRLIPESPPVHLEHWPWPIRIYTLGRFELVRDGQSVRFPGKTQKKPLELLKVLIALGGEDVAETLINDALWPDADGDLAHRSFEITLHRLRKLTGAEALQLRNGQLSLHAGQCWTDAWAFERLFADGMENPSRRVDLGARRNPQPRMSPRLLEKAAALYQGHFLPADSLETWALSMRERLRNKFLRLVLAQGMAWEQTREFSKAADCYRQGLEVDPLAEELYQRLMICQVQLGQQAEAAQAYHRCKTMLMKSLGLAPSSKTADIYTALRLPQESPQSDASRTR